MSATVKGFTLIELSIVLVIIGLIAGGILVGQDLINAAKLQKTVSEVIQLNLAVKTFQAKYSCLPGDCGNATQFFGLDATCPSGGVGTTGTCNGNSDGIIGGNLNGVNPTEDLYALNQLSLAGLVAGKFPDGPGSDACCKTLSIGVNIPVSAYSPNIGYDIMTMPVNDFQVQQVPGPARNAIAVVIGSTNVAWGDYLFGAGITAPDAARMDRKIDDGMPNSGRFTAMDSPYTGTGNANTTCLSGNSYATSVNTGCILYDTIQ